MKIEIDINEKYEDIKVLIQAKEINNEVKEIIEKISVNKEPLKVYIDDELYFIKEEDVETIYSESGKVYVKTKEKIYHSKNRLYELEFLLSKNKFIRISNSEIINFDKIKKLDSRFLGTIEISFFSGYKTYTSRRFVKRVKEFLNI